MNRNKNKLVESTSQVNTKTILLVLMLLTKFLFVDFVIDDILKRKWKYLRQVWIMNNWNLYVLYKKWSKYKYLDIKRNHCNAKSLTSKIKSVDKHNKHQLQCLDV